MIQAAAAVNDVLLRAAQQEGLAGGSTAVFALVHESEVLLGHLGDSRAVLCHVPTPGAMPAHAQQQHTGGAHSVLQHNLKAAALTVDHSPDRPDELARITAAGGFVSRATAGDITPLGSGLLHPGQGWGAVLPLPVGGRPPPASAPLSLPTHARLITLQPLSLLLQEHINRQRIYTQPSIDWE